MDPGVTIFLATVVSLYSTGHWIGATIFLGLGIRVAATEPV